MAIFDMVTPWKYILNNYGSFNLNILYKIRGKTGIGRYSCINK